MKKIIFVLSILPLLACSPSDSGTGPVIHWVKGDIVHVPKDYNSSIGNSGASDRSIYMSFYTRITDADGYQDIDEIWVEQGDLTWFIKDSDDVYDQEPYNYIRYWLYDGNYTTRVSATGYVVYVKDKSGNITSSTLNFKQPNYQDLDNHTYIYGDLDDSMVPGADTTGGVEALGIPILSSVTLDTVNLTGSFKYSLTDLRVSYIRLSIYTASEERICSYSSYADHVGTTGNVYSEPTSAQIIDINFNNSEDSDYVYCSDGFIDGSITLDQASYAVLNAYDDPNQDITDDRDFWHYRSIGYWQDIVFE